MPLRLDILVVKKGVKTFFWSSSLIPGVVVDDYFGNTVCGIGDGDYLNLASISGFFKSGFRVRSSRRRHYQSD